MRPHEALGQRPALTRYVPSPRPYPRELREFTYPHAAAVRHVGSEGTIRWHQHRLFLSEVLAGEPVGLYHCANGLWEVQLGPLTLGTFQEQDPSHAYAQHMTRGGKNDAKSVTHVVGLICYLCTRLHTPTAPRSRTATKRPGCAWWPTQTIRRGCGNGPK